MKEIWQFLLVLLAGVAFASVIVFWMVRGDAIDRKMYVHQVLLSPETLENLSNRAVAKGRDRPSEYLLEEIRFTYLNPETNKREEKEITIDPYTKFYQVIAKDRGVIDPSEAVFESFRGEVSTLSLVMKHFIPMSHEGKLEVFQSVEIDADGNDYRISLHTDSPEKEWVYFNHHAIGKIASEILKE